MLERWIAWTLGAGQRACTLSEVSNQGCAVIQPLFLHSFTHREWPRCSVFLGLLSGAGGGGVSLVQQAVGRA